MEQREEEEWEEKESCLAGLVRGEYEEERERGDGSLISVFLDQRGGGGGVGDEHILDKEEEGWKNGEGRV